MQTAIQKAAFDGNFHGKKKELWAPRFTQRVEFFLSICQGSFRGTVHYHSLTGRICKTLKEFVYDLLSRHPLMLQSCNCRQCVVVCFLSSLIDLVGVLGLCATFFGLGFALGQRLAEKKQR